MLAATTIGPVVARLGTVTSTLRRPTPSGETQTSSRDPARPVKTTARTADRLRPRTFRRAESPTLMDRLTVEAGLAPHRDMQEIPVITGRWENCVPPYALEPPALLAPEASPLAAAGAVTTSVQRRVRAYAATSARLFPLPDQARFTCGLPFAQAYGVS